MPPARFFTLKPACCRNSAAFWLRPPTLALHHDLAALIQFAYALLQIAQGNQIPADLRNFEFMRLAYIEQESNPCPRRAAA